MTAADREKMLSEMTRAEKAELLPWIVRDLGDDFPGIESKPEVMGGVPCITRTRIPVWVLEQARRLGTSDPDLLRVREAQRVVEAITKAGQLRRQLIRVYRGE